MRTDEAVLQFMLSAFTCRGRTRQKKTQSRHSKQTSTYPGQSAGLQGWVPLPLHTVRYRPGTHITVFTRDPQIR